MRRSVVDAIDDDIRMQMQPAGTSMSPARLACPVDDNPESVIPAGDEALHFLHANAAVGVVRRPAPVKAIARRAVHRRRRPAAIPHPKSRPDVALVHIIDLQDVVGERRSAVHPHLGVFVIEHAGINKKPAAANRGFEAQQIAMGVSRKLIPPNGTSVEEQKVGAPPG